MSSVPTSADPIPEADARKASEVAPPETKSREAEGDGDEGVDVVQEATVPQVTSLPAPTAPGTAKDVTVGDGGVVNGTSATVVSDHLQPPASEDDSCTSVHTVSTKQSSNTEGEGFAGDVTWEDRTWKVLVTLKEDMFWARIGGIRAVQG